MSLYRLGILIAAVVSVLSAIVLWPDDHRGSRLQLDATAAALSAAAEEKTVFEADLLALFEVTGQWTPEQLQNLASLARRLEISRGVREVSSPVTSMVPLLRQGEIEVASLDQRLSRDPQRAQFWIEQTLDDPLLRDRMIGAQRELAFVIRLSAKNAQLLDESAHIAAQLVSDWFDVSARIQTTITGAPLVTASVGEQIFRDLQRVLLLASVLSAVLLFVCFGSIPAVVLCLCTIALAIFWTLAAMAIAGIPINLITAIVPPLVMTLTLAYSMHAVFAVQAAESREDAVIELLTPLTVTAITTMAGLLALCLQDTPAIRQFGLAGSMGVLAAVAAVLGVLCPALVKWGGQLKPRAALAEQLRPIARRMAILAIRKRHKVIVLGAAVLVLGALSATQIETGVQLVSDMRQSHPTRQAYENVADVLGGANGFEIVIDSEVRDGALLPDVLSGVESLQTWMRSRPDVASSQSLVDVLKRLNQLFSDDPTQNFQLPQGLGMAKQLLLVGAPPQTAQLTDLNYSLLRIQVRTRLDDTAALAALFDAVRAQMKRDLPAGLTITLQGDAVDLVNTMQRLTSGQLQSLLLAMLGIFVVLALLFSSLSMAMRALMPNLVPVAIYFGLIGIAGIPLGPSTALVASIVLGVAVDDTLFYLVRFNHHARLLANERKATQAALRDVIQPITVTTVVVVSGFACLVTSSFTTQILFGVLAAGTLLLAWVVDLTLTPALSARSSIVTLWDVLRVDLGQSPEQTIKMLHGLSPRQARVFALLTELRQVEAGSLVVRRGDEAREMYIVIEGELRVWIEDGLELDRVERGQSFGETGLFFGSRTANVSAQSDCRLLVLNAQTLERVKRRYPRIAVQVMHNLNKVQAVHLESVNKLIVPREQLMKDALA